jgi:preprotein translocase subunit SecB
LRLVSASIRPHISRSGCKRTVAPQCFDSESVQPFSEGQSSNDNSSTCLSGQGEVLSSLHRSDVRLARLTLSLLRPVGVISTGGAVFSAGNGGFVWLCHLWQSWLNGAPAAPANLYFIFLQSRSAPRLNISGRRANPNGKPNGLTTAEQQVGFSPVQGQPDHWNLQLQLKIGSSDQNNPFCYEIEIYTVGVVALSGDIPAERRQSIAVINGLSLLYGACREMIMNITARSIFGPCSIPSVNFAQVLKEAQENKLTEQRSQLAEKSVPA